MPEPSRPCPICGDANPCSDCIAGNIPSPCNGICDLDPRTRTCRGCLRTVLEIAGWGSYTAERKRAVLDAIVDRRTQSDR
jgi:predicted Fe-S protein YdhL (DUF1289 family)